jgi:hypothetical protein
MKDSQSMQKMQIHKEIKRLEEIRKEQTIQDETHAMITIWILSRYQPHAEEKHRVKEANYHGASKNQPTRIVQNDRGENAVTNGVKLADGAMGTADSIFDPTPQTPGENMAQNTTAHTPQNNPTPRPHAKTTPNDAIERAAKRRKRRLRLHTSEIQREANNSSAQRQRYYTPPTKHYVPRNATPKQRRIIQKLRITSPKRPTGT